MGVLVNARRNAGRPSRPEYTVWTPNNRVPPEPGSYRRAQADRAPRAAPALTASMVAWPMRRAFGLTKREMAEDACLAWARSEAGPLRKAGWRDRTAVPPALTERPDWQAWP
jgi:hypothetical protein